VNIKPNPEFINSVPAEARKKWHDALVSCDKPQGRGAMIDKYGGWCCLMVGYKAFGGGKTTSIADDGTPPADCKFTEVMKSMAPYIGVSNYGKLKAHMVNDSFEYTFPQIARLVYPEAYDGEAA
jgi:hypothetical protein